MKKEPKIAAYMRVGNYIQLLENIDHKSDYDTSSKKCAIYNRYSVNCPERLSAMRDKLVSYCHEKLGICDYVLFEETGSSLKKRKIYKRMIKRINRGEFTTLLIYQADRLHKDPCALLKDIKILREKVDIYISEDETIIAKKQSK